MESNQPLRVSIVMPVLNEAKGLAGALMAAIAAAPFELIVVDGGSTDGAADIAIRSGATVLSSLPGRARQQNLGASAATGEVLLFLHGDTHLPADGIRQIQTALADPGIAGGAFRTRIDARGLLYRVVEWGNSWRVRWRKIPYGDQGIFLRREVFERLGGFPELPLLEDLRLMRRARREKCRIVLLDGPLTTSARRWQRHGVVRQTLRNWSILAAESCGVSPERLARWYRPHGE